MILSLLTLIERVSPRSKPSGTTKRRLPVVMKAYDNCKAALTENRDLLDELTGRLVEKETVDFRELYEMVGKKHPALAEAQMSKQAEMGQR